MSADRLFVDVDLENACYRIVWFLAETGEFGAIIGEGRGRHYTQRDLDRAKPDERPHIVACLTAGKSDGATRDRSGYRWEERRKAAAALRMINIAIKTDGGAPWPDWAIRAKAEGWKAPKGWKPR